MIFLTAGADEGIQLFARTYGQNAFVFTPAYIVYSDVEVYGGKLTKLYSIENSEFKIKTILIPGSTLIYLANPNNPSGITSKEDVMDLVKNNPQAKVVIDEAYGEFAELSVIDQVREYPQMAVLRSFSKAYGMAGNRIGYMIANPEIINAIRPKTQWANVSYLSIGAATIALDHEDYFKSVRDDIAKRRDEFMEFLRGLNYPILSSKINAILFKYNSEDEATQFVDYLTQNNFIVSPGNGHSNIGLDKTFVRIAVGNVEQMQTLRRVIEKYER